MGKRFSDSEEYKKSKVIYTGVSLDEAVEAVALSLEKAVPGSVFSGVSFKDTLESVQSSIQIKKSPSADSRTAKGDISKEELLDSSLMHIGDVQKALSFLANKLIEAGAVHDHTKVSGIDDFYNDFKNAPPGDKFKAGKWFKEQHLTERHHLNDWCPDDVNLIDVLERIADSTVAGMARSGSVYDEPIDSEILQRAYKNTMKLLLDNIEIVD